MSQRRYYVLSENGEIGPHNRLEIRELLHTGAIADHDTLRTAAGTSAGTVIELLNKPEESSSYRLVTVDVVEPEGTPSSSPATRRTTHRKQTSAADTPSTSLANVESRTLPVTTMALGATLVILLVGWWWLSSGDRHRAAEQVSAVAALPVITIAGTDGSWVLGRDGVVTIRAAQPVTRTLTVHLAVVGSAIPGVDFTPFPMQVDIPAGTDVARVRCQPLPVTNNRQPAVTVVVAIEPHAGYQVGATRHANVELRAEESAITQGGHAQVTWVGDLPFVDAWTAIQPPDRHQSHDHHPMAIDNVSYSRGLAMHPGDHAKDPEAHVTITLDGRYEEFLATVGIDDEMRGHSEPSVTFQVWVDGQPQFDSGVMRVTTPARTLRINVAGAKTMRLVVTDAGDGNSRDHADWGAARLISK